MSKSGKTFKTILKLGIFASTVMYGINKIIESSALSKNMLRCDDGEYFKWSHGKVYYKKYGKGSPVLLLHDVDPASSGYEWNEIIKKYTDRTIYVVDLPGCGRSSKCKGETYINYFYVRFLKEFIDEVIGEKTDIVATGLSGSFVVMTASIHKEVIGKITMINPVTPVRLSAPVTLKSKIAKSILDCPVLGTFIYYMDHSCKQIEYRLIEKSVFNPFIVTQKMIHTYYESAHILNANGKYLLSSIQGHYMGVNIERAFSSLTNNITLIFGKQIADASLTGEKYAKLNPNIKIIYIAKTKMLPQLEAPCKVINYIK